MLRRLFALGVLLFLFDVPASGQSPQTQPLLQQSAITYLGSFTAPASDGTCAFGVGSQNGCLIYGSYAISIGPVVNGQPTMFIGGHDWSDQLCQITIPAIGGTAQMVGRCQSLSNLTQIDGQQDNGYVLGGSLYVNGRVLVTATSYYPGGDTAKNTHFVSTSLSGLGSASAVRVGTIKAGSVAGYMGTIPTEWQALLGGSALAGQCCRQIIGRTSYGPAAGAFTPDTVGKQNPAPFTSLIHYPDEARALAPYSSPTPTNLFNGGTEMGGIAFPSGTRSVLFIGRHGLGGRCYGFGTSNQSLHNTPHPQGEHWCYDPTSSDKGDHAYPYVHQVWAYDAAQLAEVKAGKRQPWEVKPYAIWQLSGLPSGANNGASIRSATYDDTTRRLYVTEATGSRDPRVHVFQVAGTSTNPPPVNCQLAPEWNGWQAVTPWSACVAGSQSQQQRRTRDILVPPANGGAACGPTEETRTATQACTVEPPPVTSITVKGTLMIDPIQLGPAAYYIVVKTEHGAWAGQLPGARIPGAIRDLKAGDFVSFEAALNPAVK